MKRRTVKKYAVWRRTPLLGRWYLSARLYRSRKDAAGDQGGKVVELEVEVPDGELAT